MSIKQISFACFCIASIALLCTLGTWQVQRLAWKTGIIDRIESEYARDPAQNILRFKDLQAQQDLDLPLLYGRMEGRLEPRSALLLGPKTLDGQIGHHVIAPMRLRSGGIVFVNLGFTNAQDIKDITLPAGRLSVDGIARKPDWNAFSPGNAPDQDIWMKPDIAEMAGAKNYDLKDVAPLMLYAQNASRTLKDITFLDARWMPRNNHKQYAIFWFSMAGIFTVFFGAFAYRTFREKA